MLVRCQILIDDWLESHIKSLAKQAGISFSEAIRIWLCQQAAIDGTFPQVKTKNKEDRDEARRHIDNLYYECRKTIESAN